MRWFMGWLSKGRQKASGHADLARKLTDDLNRMIARFGVRRLSNDSEYQLVPLWPKAIMKKAAALKASGQDFTLWFCPHGYGGAVYAPEMPTENCHWCPMAINSDELRSLESKYGLPDGTVDCPFGVHKRRKLKVVSSPSGANAAKCPYGVYRPPDKLCYTCPLITGKVEEPESFNPVVLAAIKKLTECPLGVRR
jgi:hypothetical protein